MITNAELYDFLKSKGVTHLHHANSVATAITFIQNGGLYSRGAVEANGWYQTPQDSDYKDKQVDVYNDVFFDVVDLHRWTYGKKFSEQLDNLCEPQENIDDYAFKANFYGPVLFKYKLEILLDWELDIKITKTNPIYWKIDFSDDDKYYGNINDYKNDFEIDTYRKMITIRSFVNNTHTYCQFQTKEKCKQHLDEIILDECNKPYTTIHGVKNYSQISYDVLYNELQKKGLESKLKIRKCFRRCSCHYYLEEKGYNIRTMFLPKEELEKMNEPNY